jgi:2-aminoethylphosphonate-pyruvate transaminase
MLPPEEYSCVLWSWLLPMGLSYSDVHAALKAEGFVVYAGQGDFSKQIFRIAHMGDIHKDDLERLDVALRSCFS